MFWPASQTRGYSYVERKAKCWSPNWCATVSDESAVEDINEPMKTECADDNPEISSEAYDGHVPEDEQSTNIQSDGESVAAYRGEETVVRSDHDDERRVKAAFAVEPCERGKCSDNKR
jgi:hypothetical protein